jgi:hypothetical protein
MITLTLEWREVLWWMQGGMSGSHNCWDVYKDMVNKVWPQCSEQERRNLWLIMRRDLGTYWRPDGWSGFDLANAHGEGEWKPAAAVLTYSDDKRYDSSKCITDLTPWTYFRQVLARFDPENQYAVTLKAETDEEVEGTLKRLPKETIISTPTLMLSADKTRYGWRMDMPIVVRTYKWQDLNGNDAYFIDWQRRCDPDRIAKVEKIDIPDDGTM